jgi:hypothetical protein
MKIGDKREREKLNGRREGERGVELDQERKYGERGIELD